MTETARRAVAANPVWYHAIELAPGVVTPGRADWRHAAALGRAEGNGYAAAAGCAGEAAEVPVSNK